MQIDGTVIDIWTAWQKDIEDDYQYYASLLSPIEMTRAQNYLIPKKSTQYILGRGWMKDILSRYLNISPFGLDICYQSQGKPYLCQEYQKQMANRIEFNLSHSGDLFLLGVVKGTKLGIDLEEVNKVEGIDYIAKMYLLRKDYDVIYNEQDHHAKLLLFLEKWTQLEANKKMLGSGIGHMEDEVYPSSDVYTWRPDPNFIASVTIEGKIGHIRRMNWQRKLNHAK